jgi:rare lipoprotein A
MPPRRSLARKWGYSDIGNGKWEAHQLKPYLPSRNQRLLRNLLMSCAMAALVAAGAGLRPASAKGHPGLARGAGLTRGDGAHRAAGIGDSGAWRHDRQGRRGVREKLFVSGRLPLSRIAQPTGGDSGIASVYDGDRTASGERMKPGAMTAAHRTLPFGTEVTVVNHRNGRSAVVRINDRGPFVRGRVIDLSPAAARALGVDGLVPVSLSVGKTGETREGDF